MYMRANRLEGPGAIELIRQDLLKSQLEVNLDSLPGLTDGVFHGTSCLSNPKPGVRMTGIKKVKPKNKRFKKALAKIILFILGRAFQVISRSDRTVEKEVGQWPEGFKLELAVHPHGPSLKMQMLNGYLSAKDFGDHTADLSMEFKHIESAMLVLLPIAGVPRAFAERRITVTGDVARAMSFVQRGSVLPVPGIRCRPGREKTGRPGLEKKVARAVLFLHDRNHHRITRFALKENKRCFLPIMNFITRLKSFQDIGLLKISRTNFPSWKAKNLF
jgi:hypothetical protein